MASGLVWEMVIEGVSCGWKGAGRRADKEGVEYRGRMGGEVLRPRMVGIWW